MADETLAASTSVEPGYSPGNPFAPGAQTPVGPPAYSPNNPFARPAPAPVATSPAPTAATPGQAVPAAYSANNPFAPRAYTPPQPDFSKLPPEERARHEQILAEAQGPTAGQDAMGTIAGIAKAIGIDLPVGLFNAVTAPLRDVFAPATPEELRNPYTQSAMMSRGGMTPGQIEQQIHGAILQRAQGGPEVGERSLDVVKGLVTGAYQLERQAIEANTPQDKARALTNLVLLAGGTAMGARLGTEEPAVVVPPEARAVAGSALGRVLVHEGVKPTLEAPELVGHSLEAPESLAARSMDDIANEATKLSLQATRTPAEQARLLDLNVQLQRGEAQLPPPINGGGRTPSASDPNITADDILNRHMNGTIEPVAGAGATVAPRPVETATVPPALRAVLDKVSIGEQKAKPEVGNLWGRTITNAVDDMYPIDRVTRSFMELEGKTTKAEQIPGQRLPTLDDPYVMARLTTGATAKGTGFLEFGPRDWKTGEVAGPGLTQIIKPIVQAGKLDELRAYTISQRVLELSQRGIETPVDPKIAARASAEASPEVVAAHAAVLKYQDQVLQYAVDSGVIPANQAAQWRALNQQYVPFYHFINDGLEGARAGIASGKKMGSVAHGVKAIKGGSGAPIIDPLESIVKNTYGMVSLADRYAVSDALARLSEDHPENPLVQKIGKLDQTPEAGAAAKALAPELQASGIENPAGTAQQLAGVLARETHQGAFWVWRNGEKTWFHVEPDVYEALMGIDKSLSPLLRSLLSYPSAVASIEKAGLTTLSPRYGVVNPIRTQFVTTLYSRYGYTPAVDLVRGLFHVLKRDDLYEDFFSSGAGHAALVRQLGREREQFTLGKMAEQGLSPIQRTYNIITSPRQWGPFLLENMRRVSETMDTATRMGEFMRAKQATGDLRGAAFASKEANVDFSMAGKAGRIANQLTPFTNAIIQDLYKFSRTAAAEGPRRAAGVAAKGMAAMTIPTIGLYLLNRDDPNYHELSEARKDNYWNIPLSSKDPQTGAYVRNGKFASVRIPFIMGYFYKILPERAMRYADVEWQKANAAKLATQRPGAGPALPLDPDPFQELAKNTFDNLVPPIIPGIAKPAIEAWANKDFYRGRPIVPTFEQKLPPAEQFGPMQGVTTQALGRALNVSPRQVEHLIRGYTGDVGTMIMAGTDAVLQHAGVKGVPGATPRGALAPVGSAFLVNEPTISSRSVERFYTKLNEISMASTTLNTFMKDGRGEDAVSTAKAYRAELLAAPMFNNTREILSNLRNAIRATQQNTSLTDEERQQRVLELGRAMRTTARLTMDAYVRVQQQLEEQDKGTRTASGGVTLTDTTLPKSAMPPEVKIGPAVPMPTTAPTPVAPVNPLSNQRVASGGVMLLLKQP